MRLSPVVIPHLLNPTGELWSDAEGDFSRYSPRFGKFKSYSGPAWEFVEKTLEKALSSGWSLLDLNTAVGSGAYLLEIVPMAPYTMMLYADDPTKAITLAVFSSKDSRYCRSDSWLFGWNPSRG
ncbi:hypothetical protein [Thermococcus waiotapuensis]|uniref:Uncharacterized protein n=1 Tax=Thermococcus waiotapuensis TaxID=90909 RepID=A0AAE4NXU8_9EURY|nr:hypothetical protein [Thermococcus waiotapuensis]MDV3104685.1 hypothetical protein [Thermococcus waiotapuensis]